MANAGTLAQEREGAAMGAGEESLDRVRRVQRRYAGFQVALHGGGVGHAADFHAHLRALSTGRGGSSRPKPRRASR